MTSGKALSTSGEGFGGELRQGQLFGALGWAANILIATYFFGKSLAPVDLRAAMTLG